MECHLSLRAAGVQRQGLPSLREWALCLQHSPPNRGASLGQQLAGHEELVQRRVARLSCGAGSRRQEAQSHDAHSHQHSAHCGHSHGDEPVHLNASASEEEGAVGPAVLPLCSLAHLPQATPDRSVWLQ